VNKKFIQVCIAALFLITACSQNSARVTSLATDTPTQYQTEIPTFAPHVASTKTPRELRNEPTGTPLLPTPLPTIPTFTPTFDVSIIITVTPAQIEECPEQSIEEAAQQIVKEPESVPTPVVLDVTNDGLPEIILSGDSSDGFGTGSVYIVGCKNGLYMALEEISSLEYPSPQLWTVQDLNGNGIPEIVIAIKTCGGWGSCWVISILEWNGEAFRNIVDEQINQEISPWLDNLDFRDMDHNGTIEIIVSRGLPSYPDSLSDGTWREYTEIYSWNGTAYAQMSHTLTPAKFRFQAIQDADEETLKLNYALALSLYQDAIFSDKLDWWSFDRYLYHKNNFWISIKSTAVPTPYPDSTEYPKLAAYAYYRIMLLHIIQGHESDAGTVYYTLQLKFSNDPNGQPYVEMANEFWNAYQTTQQMYEGCVAAIEYAQEHPDILAPLGSDYHGRQSHFYEPSDVCPFR
jgi:hypothetical protein